MVTEIAARLRIRNADFDELCEVPLPGRRPLSIAWAPTAPDLLNTLRPALVADLVRRLVELRGGQAAVHTAGPVHDLVRFNVHPASEPPAGGADIAVGAGAAGHLSVAVGPATAAVAGQVEPLAARLALLAAPHAAPVSVDAATLAAASLRLTRWRHLLVHWAGLPSAAMPTRYVAGLADRAADDLDIPGLLDLVERAAGDDGVPEGGRFEFLLYADRVLGLDLAAGLGS